MCQVASKSMRPYVFKTPDEFDWWTIYISAYCPVGVLQHLIIV
jgi:hypothetical protein